MKVAFRTWRELQTRKQDTTFIEQDAAFHVGWLGHYVADAAQPLHSNVNHDGWVGDNPKNYTRDGAIHWQFENTFVDLIGLKEGDIRARIPPAARRVADPFTAMLQHIDRAHTRVEQAISSKHTRPTTTGLIRMPVNWCICVRRMPQRC